jgi:hypothetical protein
MLADVLSDVARADAALADAVAVPADAAPAEDVATGEATTETARLAPPVTWRHAAIWACLAAVALLATLVVLDNFILVEVRLPGRAVRARLGWVVVSSVGIGFLAGWVVGRLGRRRVSRADRGLPGSA